MSRRAALPNICGRIYLDGEAGNAADPVMDLVPADRRDSLIAKHVNCGEATYRFDIHLQGDRETVLFDV